MGKMFILTLAVVALTAAVRAQRNDNIDIKVNVDSDSKTYHQFKTQGSSFNYGYNVAKKNFNQFQHKVRGPDDVTYGCYGFIDPKNGTHLYHYVSDLNGYRVVAPDKPTKIYRQRVAESVKQLLEAVEEQIPWERLYFPEVCRYLYLSHKTLNKFELPDEIVVKDDGSIVKEPTKSPQTPKAATPRPFSGQPAVTPDASSQRFSSARLPTTAIAPVKYTPAVPTFPTPQPRTSTAKPAAPTRRVPVFNQQPQGPQRVAPNTPRPTPAPHTFAPHSVPTKINNEFGTDLYKPSSKVVAKPIENPWAPKPTVGSVGSTRPNLPQATTKLETVLLPSKQSDLDAIGQDVREVKASLKKLIEHIFSRKADCDTPNARTPAGVQPATGGHVTAYLPLVLADFPSGSVPVGPSASVAPVASVPISASAGHPSGHPSGTFRLALPAYPAFQPPQCPVCRSDRNKK